MTIVEGFYDEVGFFESSCSSITWKGDSLELFYDSGVSLGGSDHPLADSFEYGSPCRIIFTGVVTSKLKVAQFISNPNIFKYYDFENLDLPKRKADVSYSDYYLEGQMLATTPTGWYTWDIIADRFYFDDLK